MSKVTREYLTQYIYIESYIKSIRRRLRYFENHPVASTHGVVKGSRKEFPFIECHFVVSAPSVKSDEERNKIVNQLIIDLKGNEILYNDMQLDIENYIESIEDLEQKTILRLKYIDRMSDEKIGEELGYSRSSINDKLNKILNIL